MKQKKDNKKKRKTMQLKFNATKKKAKAERDVHTRKKILREAKTIKTEHDKEKKEYL